MNIKKIEDIRDVQKNVDIEKEAQFISIVVYVHNDSDKIIEFNESILKYFEKKFKQCEVIYVDDYSTDNSVDVIRKYYKQNSVDYGVSIIRMGHYHGIEISMNAGRDMSIGDFVYEFDSLYIDYDDKIVFEAYEKCLEGNDIVIASTDVPLRLSSRIFYRLFNRVSSSKTEIGQETFRLLSRRGINRITSMDINIPYRKAIYLNCGLSTAQIRYKSLTGDRPARITQKYERINLALDSFIYFTNIVERMSMLAIVGISILAIAVMIYFINLGISNTYKELALTLLVTAGFVGIFCLNTIIVKYLSILVDLVFKNQKYLIADVDKIS